MGFLNKTRDPAALKNGKKKLATNDPTTAAILLIPASPEKKKLLHFFNKIPADQQPPPPYSPTDNTPKQAPIIVIPQIPNSNTLQPITQTTKVSSTPAAASSIESSWHISDVIFLVEGKRIPSHKVVLVSRCAYFARLLRDTPAGSVTTIDIREFSHHIFSRFIRLVYGGKRENIAPEDTPELIRCSFAYEAHEIATVCQEVLAEANERLRAELEQREREELEQRIQQQQEELRLQQELEIQQQIYQQQFQLQLQMQLNNNNNNNNSQPLFISSEVQLQLQQLYHSQQQQLQQQPPPIDPRENFDIEGINAGFVITDPSLDNFGMNTWSNDPVLFSGFEQTEGYRIMEIC